MIDAQTTIAPAAYWLLATGCSSQTGPAQAKKVYFARK
jgi:hypothetical protein